MSLEAELFKKLDSLIRAAHAELGTLQLHLIEAHERELNPAELGVHIANLGRQISAWKRERASLSRSTTTPSEPATDAAPNGGSPQEAANVGVAPSSRRAASPKKNQTRSVDRPSMRPYSASAAFNALI